MNTTDTVSATAADGQNVSKFTLNPKCKVELVASKDVTRQAILNVRVEYSERFKGNVAVATNGRSMAIVPVTSLPDDEEQVGKAKVATCLISPEALKASRSIKRDGGTFSLNGKIELSDGRAFNLPAEAEFGTYPNWQQCIPGESDKITFSVALNPTLLLDLAKAIGSPDSIRLNFIDEKSPIQIRGGAYASEPDARGVLMPMRLS